MVEILEEERGPLVTSEVAVAEADYLILTRLGIDVELAFLDDLAEGTFLIECLTREELGVARVRARRHRDLELGLADVSLVVLARRYRSRRILTFDERAFRTVTPPCRAEASPSSPQTPDRKIHGRRRRCAAYPKMASGR